MGVRERDHSRVPASVRQAAPRHRAEVRRAGIRMGARRDVARGHESGVRRGAGKDATSICPGVARGPAGRHLSTGKSHVRAGGSPAMSDGSPQLSIVVPIKDEIEILPELTRRLTAVIDDQMPDAEIVFVDDGSMDGSARWIAEKHAEDPRIKLVRLSRNFGHQAAVTA